MTVIICLFLVSPNRRVWFCTVGEGSMAHRGLPKAVNQLSYTPLLILLSSAVGGNVVITCCEARRDWLQQLRLINNGWHVQHYANEAARVVQELWKSCRARLFFYFILAQSGKIFARFLCKSFILFYFIANGRTALLWLMSDLWYR